MSMIHKEHVLAFPLEEEEMEKSQRNDEGPSSFGDDIVSCLAQDQLQVMLRTEAAYQMADFPCITPPHERICTEDWRRKICQWSYKVVDTFRLDRSIVAVSLKLLDRFILLLDTTTTTNRGDQQLGSDAASLSASYCPCLSCKRSMDSSRFQLASMATLCIAIKISPEADSDSELERRKHFRVATMVDFSRGLFSQRDIAEMEARILSVLHWKVNPPTSTLFIPYLLDLLPPPQSPTSYYPVVHKFLTEVSRYLCELGVSLGMEFNEAFPSEVAFSSLLASIKLLTLHALPKGARSHFCSAFYQQSPKSRQERIDLLVGNLLAVLWPEMILQHEMCHDPSHPISLALHYGLLDLSCIQKQPCQTDPTMNTASPPQSPMINYTTPCSSTAYDPQSPVSTIL